MRAVKQLPSAYAIDTSGDDSEVVYVDYDLFLEVLPITVSPLRELG